MSITDFQCTQNDNVVEWIYDGRKVKKEFSVNVYAEKLKNCDGVVIIYRSKDKAPNNADIYSGDGTLYRNIINPVSQNNSCMFTDIYYANQKILMIINEKINNFSCVLESSGETHSLNETR